MAWGTTKGFNFRSSLGYVTDGTNQQYVGNGAGSGLYPTTSTIGGDSVTYGWDTATTIRDRDNTVDVRLAGMHFMSGSAANFRVDLPATGSYKIRLAIGDASFNHSPMHTVVLDNASTLLTSNAGTASADMLDATFTEYSNAAWPGSNAQVTITMTSTILIVRIDGTSDLTCIAHLEVQQAGGGGGSRGLFQASPLSGVGSGGSGYFRDPLAQRHQ